MLGQHTVELFRQRRTNLRGHAICVEDSRRHVNDRLLVVEACLRLAISLTSTVNIHTCGLAWDLCYYVLNRHMGTYALFEQKIAV